MCSYVEAFVLTGTVPELECLAFCAGFEYGRSKISQSTRLCITFQPLKIGPHLGGVLKPKITVLFESLKNDLFELWRKIWIQPHC
jgi:hypothetical protein